MMAIMTDPSLPPQRMAEAAAAFAAALGRDDFATAGGWLAADCVCEAGREVLSGRDAVLAAFAKVSALNGSRFDDVRHESEVVSATDSVVTLRFTDYLVKAGGQFHRHRTVQRVTFDVEGRIVRIVHEEDTVQSEALRVFCRACGVEPQS